MIEGGSIGSALAVLTFYPLERVRVELQSGAVNRRRNDRRDEIESGELDEQDQEIVDYERSASPSSSNESFEIVYDPEISDSDKDQCPSLVPRDGCQVQVSNKENRLVSESILQCLVRLHRENTLYNGASQMTTTLMISNFIFFYALQICRRSMRYIQQRQIRRQHQHKGTSQGRTIHNILLKIFQSKMATSLIASSVAGFINVLMTNPLWVASLRMMEGKMPTSKLATNGPTKHQPILFAIMSDIAKSEGVQQLWSGTWTSLLLVSNPIIQHFVYEQMRSWSLQEKLRQIQRQGREIQSSSLSPAQAFVFGAVAKAVATFLTYPLQLAQVLLRLQTRRIQISVTEESNQTTEQLDTIERSYTGTIDCLRRQFASGGISALFTGMDAKLLQTVLTSAFTFLTYEQVLVLVGRIYDTVK